MIAAVLSQLVAVGLGGSPCGVLDVALSGNLKLPPVVEFPGRAACGTGLTLIAGGSATYTPGNDHEVNIPVRILNRASGPVKLPIRVILSSQAIQIIGSGKPSNLTAVGPDSVLADGSALWWIGPRRRLLEAGRSTMVKRLTIRFAGPATHAKLAFAFDGMPVVLNPVPALAPETVPDWVNDDSSYTRSGRGSLKRTLVVLFTLTATQAERQAAVDRVRGRVVGGYGIPGSDGSYLVRVGWDPTEAQLDSLASVLRSLTQVEAAGRVRRSSEGGRRPDHGADWGPGNRRALAWGCGTIDPP